MLRRVRLQYRSPTSTLVCGPPTPPFPSTSSSGLPSPLAYLGADACSAPCGRRLVPSAYEPRVGDSLSGSPWCRFLPRRNVGLPGSWVILFLRAVVVHPAGCDLPSPLPLSGRPPSPSGKTAPWASGMTWFSWPLSHGPHARAPTHRRPRRRNRRKARYRSRRLAPSPDGFRTCWMTYRISWAHRITHSLRTSLSWSHCFSHPEGAPAGERRSLIVAAAGRTPRAWSRLAEAGQCPSCIVSGQVDR